MTACQPPEARTIWILGALRQQRDRLVVDAVDGVDLAGNQSIEPRGPVVDDRDLDAVEPAAPFLPVVAGLLERDAHARIELVQAEGASPDRLGPILEAIRHHVHMIVGQSIGQVRVRPVQRNLYLILVELLDVGDRLERARAAGFGVASMQVERVDGVVGGELLTVRELDPLAQVEDPVLSAVPRLVAFGQIRMRPAVLAPLDNAVEQAVAGVDHHRVVIGGDVDAVRGAATAEPKPEDAAFLGRLSGDGVSARQHGGNRDARGAERGGAAHELTTRNGALKQAPVPIIQFAHLAWILSTVRPSPDSDGPLSCRPSILDLASESPFCQSRVAGGEKVRVRR